ncbi:MAG: hypothetical protein Q8O72_08845 [Bacteroidales bacterium]|nr:hypothetical protein [Bacteroidales bacterium]
MTFNFFKRDHKSIPENITPKLLAIFPRAINIEWNKAGDNFEALFYMDEVEYIARLSEKGLLLEYKKNVRTNEIPEKISLTATGHGEIMSAIAIYQGETLVHEIIVRKPDLSRYLLLLDDEGHLLEMRGV